MTILSSIISLATLILPLSQSAPPTSTPFSPSLRCNTSALLPTPDTTPHRTSPIFTICAETTASNTTLSHAYAAILDFPRYPLWNTFVTSVDTPANATSAAAVYVGMPMTFHTQGLLPPLNTTSNEEIAVLNPPRELDGDGADGTGQEGARSAYAVWRFVDGVGGLGVQAEHPTIVTDLGGGRVRVVSYETYYQLGSLVIGALLRRNLQEQFGVQAADLKAYLERGGGG